MVWRALRRGCAAVAHGCCRLNSSSACSLHPGCAGLCELHFDLVKAHFGEAMQDAGAQQVRLAACPPAWGASAGCWLLLGA